MHHGSSASYPARAYGIAFGWAFVMALVYVLSTDAAWEDWYIAFRAAKHLAAGEGLVYQTGERVYAFTSPLGALIPAGLSWVWGPQGDRAVLWCYRLLSCALLGGVAVLLLEWARRCRWSFWPAVLLIGWVVLDAKILGFSVSGMETPFVLFFLALTLVAMVTAVRWRSALLGVAWAGLMWSRPDSVVYIAGLGLGMLVANARPSGVGSRAALVGMLVRAGLVTAVLYLPWFLWAWSYYGSPVPQTVAAKGLQLPEGSFWEGLAITGLFPVISLVGPTSLDGTFSPTHALEGGWHPAILWTSRYLSWLAAMAWIIPAFDARLRAVSFGALAGLVYLSAFVPTAFPWYFPPAALLCLVVLAGLLEEAVRRWPTSPVMQRAAGVVTIALLLVTLPLTAAAGYANGLFRQLIEKNHRREIGLWLAANTPPDANVFVESLGYIGFFSNRKILDYPGLSSTEVLEVRRELARRSLNTRSYGLIIEALKPDWLVLRRHEADDVRRDVPGLLERDYREVTTFDARDRLREIAWLPGRHAFEFDATYDVFQRRDLAPPHSLALPWMPGVTPAPSRSRQALP